MFAVLHLIGKMNTEAAPTRDENGKGVTLTEISMSKNCLVRRNYIGYKISVDGTRSCD